MASKSLAKTALLDYCRERAAESGYKGCSFERKDSPKMSANLVLIDGFVLMDAQGHGCCLPTLREVTLAEIMDVDSDEESATDRTSVPETDSDFNFANTGFEPNSEREAAKKKARELAERAHSCGLWRHFTANIRRVLEAALARPGVTTVVFGFDKKQFVDQVKRITHTKRSEERKRARGNQIQRDRDAGLVDTRGIPFTFADIAPAKLMPYPWTEVRGSSEMLSAVIRYICLDICKNIQLPADKKCSVILDGHQLQHDDLQTAICPEAPVVQATIPVVVSHEGVGNAVAMENCVGEFDHTMFYYLTSFLQKPSVGSIFNFAPPTRDAPAVVRFRTNDTDAFLFGLVYQEYMCADDVNVQLVIEFPGKFGKPDTIIDIAPLERFLASELPNLQWPAASVVYALFLKSNDYDAPFLHGVGPRTLLNALMHHAAEIGDLVGGNPAVATSLDLPRYQRIMYPDALQKLVMAVCVHVKHFSRVPKAIKADPCALRLQMRQKLAEYKRVTYREICLAARSGRVQLPDVHELLQKWLRHIYFIAINEDLMLARARSIPYESIEQYGYSVK